MLRSDATETQDLFPVEPRALSPVEPRALELALELKGSVFTLPVLCIRSSDLDALDAQLADRLARSPKFFENAPIVVDLEGVRDQTMPLDFSAFVHLLRSRHLFPVGIQNGSPDQNDAAMATGLAVLKGRAMKELPQAASRRKGGNGKMANDVPQDAAPTPPETQSPITADTVLPATTKVINQPIRSGQRVIARGGDLIVLAPVSAGAEIIAEGNIHVYASLRGRALAGVSGDTSARIFCQHMEAELVAVAGNYRVFDDNLPKEIRGKSVQVFLDGEQLVVAPID